MRAEYIPLDKHMKLMSLCTQLAKGSLGQRHTRTPGEVHLLCIEMGGCRVEVGNKMVN